MGKFQKRPVVIDAEQWFPGRDVDGVEEQPPEQPNAEPIGIVRTLEGDMIARSGDWIITGVEGEKYPCKNEIFKKTYEPAN